RFAIDDEGFVLDMPPPEGAPVIAQTDAPATPIGAGTRVDDGAIAVAQRLIPTAEQTLGRRVVALEFTQANGLTVVLDGEVRVTFGDAQAYDFKLAALFAVLQRAEGTGRAVQSVDLRFPERVAVRWG
ncbi:MAG: cell division protein FtsQ/DivIB, partial [Dehalococcoidia bacterium]|nr:cell division protein FtsQ/DivIB [Dehalococcoidia bacterium]